MEWREQNLNLAETLFPVESIAIISDLIAGNIKQGKKGSIIMKSSIDRQNQSKLLSARGIRLLFCWSEEAVAITLIWLTFSSVARAACQEGCLANSNTVLGEDALLDVTSGFGNTAIGFEALIGDTIGGQNTATGAQALSSNTSGGRNTANGFEALRTNSTGSSNTAVGIFALQFNTTGSSNTASGDTALEINSTGNDNTATGAAALENNTASNNTAEGFSALKSNTSGASNTAIGFNALTKNTTGSNNIAIGASAGSNLTTGSNNIHIGAIGLAGESNTVRIGSVNTPPTGVFIQGINGVTVAGGVGVLVNSSGRLGTMTSSARYKENIQPMDKASEAILALKPVTFRYKHELDPDGIPQFGLVAEQVEKVNPDLVARDKEGKPYTVRYEEVNAMLLNEFLKEHRKVETQSSEIADLKATVAEVKAALKEQAAQIQKVSAQIAATQPVPRVASNQ